jgi:hypothetical protein
MTTIEPKPNDVVCVLPIQVVQLGEALPPVIESVRLAIARKVRSSGLEFEALADGSTHLGVITNALTQLSPRIEGLMTDVIRNENAGLAEASRAAGRLEQVLSEFVEGYQTAKAAHAVDADSKEARSLILGVYRHHVRVICDWLDELVHAINNPIAALDRQSIPVTADAVLTVTLNMTSPPEMAKLDALAKRRQRESEASLEAEPLRLPPSTSMNQSPGIFGTIGALVFGLGLTNAVLGRHRHR